MCFCLVCVSLYDQKQTDRNIELKKNVLVLNRLLFAMHGGKESRRHSFINYNKRNGGTEGGGRDGGRHSSSSRTLDNRRGNLQIGAEVSISDLAVFLCEFLHRLQGDSGVRTSSRGGAAGSWLKNEGGEGGREGGRVRCAHFFSGRHLLSRRRVRDGENVH